MRFKANYIGLILLFVSFSLFAQSEEQLEIVATDSTDMRQSRTPEGILLELVKNVHLRQGKAEMFCDHVRWLKEKGEVIIEQNVRIFDEHKELYADYVYYYIDSRVYKAYGNVVLKDSVRQVDGDEIQYFKLKDLIIADGNVFMQDRENFIEITSKHAELDNEKDYALITGDPIFIKKDSTNQEELRITGLKMELFEGGDKAVVTDSVKITHSEATARCDIAEFYRKTNEAVLKGTPVVRQKYDRLSGGIIHLFINKENNELRKAIVKDHAIVTSRVDTTRADQRINKLLGQQITMFFERRRLQKVVVENKATSYYYVIEDNEEKGLNKIIGDKITVLLKDRKITDIVIESTPQLSEGVFYPTGQAPEKEGK